MPAIGCLVVPWVVISMPTDTASSMYPCMHEISSLGSGFRTAMEGYARAGITAVEPHLEIVRPFEKSNGPGSARRLLDDLGLEVVSSSNQLFLDESGPQRDKAIEDMKWKLELMVSIGADRLVCPSVAGEQHSMADYREVQDNLAEAADLAAPYQVSLMVEFTRVSTLLGSLRTALQVVRTIDHPHLRNMIDLYHFWSGTSKFEDLDEIRSGEIHHVHIADVPATPHNEVFEQKDRAWPGEGIAPLERIIGKLKEKGYSGPLSLELFDPAVQEAAPFETASRAVRVIAPLL